jgi:hypothetical protein
MNINEQIIFLFLEYLKEESKESGIINIDYATFCNIFYLKESIVGGTGTICSNFMVEHSYERICYNDSMGFFYNGETTNSDIGGGERVNRLNKKLLAMLPEELKIALKRVFETKKDETIKSSSIKW